MSMYSASTGSVSLSPMPELQLLICYLNVQERGVMTMQLLGRNDPSTDDSETLADRWRNYIGSYVLVSCLFCSILTFY